MAAQDAEQTTRGSSRHWVLSAGKLSLGTMLSRVLGLGRDMLRAYLFGTGMAADAFTVAFRLPNMLRALFAEGALSAAFVPVLAGVMEQGKPGEWQRFVLNCAAVLALTLMVVSLLGILIAPVLIPVIVPGYAKVAGKIELTVELTRMLFPYIFFIGLATLAMGTLNSLRHFTAPALSAAVLNLGMIGAMLYLCPRLGTQPEERIVGLAWGVMIGGALQLAIQIPPLLRHRLAVAFRLTLSDPRLKRVFLLMLPGVLGMAVAEINAFVDTFLGSLLEAGSVSALEYGHRVMQLPLGVFAVAIGTAVLPTLSRYAARDETGALEEAFDLALRLTFFILLPIMGVFLIAHRPLLQLLFERGAFSGGHSLDLVSSAFVFYTVGLCAYGAVKVIVPVFYARQNTRTPARTAIVSMGANIVLNIILMRYLALGGLALATALASTLNVTLLLFALNKQYGLRPSRGVLMAGLRAGVATLGAMLVAGVLLRLIGADTLPRLILQLAAALTASATAYLILARLLGSRELGFLTGLLRRRRTQ